MDVFLVSLVVMSRKFMMTFGAALPHPRKWPYPNQSHLNSVKFITESILTAQVSSQNDKGMRTTGELVGRPVMIAPWEPHAVVLKKLYPTSRWSQMMVEAGLQLQSAAQAGRSLAERLPLLRSNL